MFRIGDLVAYGNEGVCRIDGTTTRDFRGTAVEYYVLKPVFNDSSTVFVPLSSDGPASRMRPVLTREAAEALLTAPCADDNAWIRSDNERRILYKEIILANDAARIYQQVSILHSHRLAQLKIGKKLHMVDERFLREAEKLIYNELAVALGMDPAEVPAYIASKTTC